MPAGSAHDANAPDLNALLVARIRLRTIANEPYSLVEALVQVGVSHSCRFCEWTCQSLM